MNSRIEDRKDKDCYYVDDKIQKCPSEVTGDY